MGGRPKGSRNKTREDWRVAAKKAAEVGRRCDEVQAELEKRARNGSLSALELARFAILVATRQKTQRTRSLYVRPIVKKGGLEIIHTKKAEPTTGASVAGSDHVPEVPTSDGNASPKGHK